MVSLVARLLGDPSGLFFSCLLTSRAGSDDPVGKMREYRILQVDKALEGIEIESLSQTGASHWLKIGNVLADKFLNANLDGLNGEEVYAPVSHVSMRGIPDLDTCVESLPRAC